MWYTKHITRIVACLSTAGLFATSNTSAVTLGWDPSSSAGVAGYRIYWGGASGSYTNYLDVGNATSASISNLSGGNPYFFSVTAYNTLSVESGFGNEISYVPTNTVVVTNPPIAGTVGATAVTATSASLSGLVNPEGALTMRWFDWGKTTNFGNRTASASAGQGVNTVAVSDGLSGLLPGTLYFFRVAATNGAGAATGGTLTFTTSLLVPIVSVSPPTSVNWKSATLNGLVNPNGAATACWFEYGLSTNYGSVTPAIKLAGGTTGVPVSAPISGLVAGYQYHFRLAASNVVAKVDSGDALFQTGDRRIARK
jgi:hypothetical protein